MIYQYDLEDLINELTNTYDYEDCKEIVRGGCQSGVCHKHIYYADTIGFFEKNPQAIADFIKDSVGSQVILDTLKKHDGELQAFQNELVWIFIELWAMRLVDDYEDAVTDLEDVAESNGYNPSRSMTESRYANV